MGFCIMINFCSFPTKNNKSKNSGGISMGTLAFDKKYIYNKLLKKKKKKTAEMLYPMEQIDRLIKVWKFMTSRENFKSTDFDDM